MAPLCHAVGLVYHNLQQQQQQHVLQVSLMHSCSHTAPASYVYLRVQVTGPDTQGLRLIPAPQANQVPRLQCMSPD